MILGLSEERYKNDCININGFTQTYHFVNSCHDQISTKNMFILFYLCRVHPDQTQSQEYQTVHTLLNSKYECIHNVNPRRHQTSESVKLFKR